MSESRDKMVRGIFLAALEKAEGPEREAYLTEVCGQDAPLRQRVAELLRLQSQAGDFLETPVTGAPGLPPVTAAGLTEKAGDQIGPYKLLQQIGEGGYGVVYLAEQEHPIRRRVALKVIKLGMDTRQVIGRFEAERQALALMDHPNIAKVLDAGATEAGRPYFVMELVRGIRITKYCDERNLSTEERLGLFVEICHAIQHAHQKGIIHRDLKPSNILVTLVDGRPVAKIIDFGIAKATGGQALTDKTVFTAFEQFIGTPAYMSPEQAQMSALDIDTRSDIYALGVLLYELLTGHTPFNQQELVAAGLDEMRRIIREQEPQRPSTRLSTLAAADQTTVAKCRHSEPPQLIHLVRGDLDWIVMRCLEKDRMRRYETANSLVEDIVRHLNNEPVMARPPSKLYRLQKLVKRNKASFAAAAMVTLALVLGLGFSLWTLAKERVARRQALAAEQKAEAEAGKSQHVARFLKDMLQGVGPSVALGRDTTMLKEILDKTAGRVGKDLKGQPEVEAELRTTLGDVYSALGQFDQAEAMYREALRLRRTLWGNMNTNVADSLDRLGHELRSCRGELVESRSLIEQALMIRTNLLGPEHVQVADSLDHLGGVQLYENDLAGAADVFRRSLAMRRRLLGNDRMEVAQSLIALSDVLRDLARPEEAEAHAREALTILSRLAADERAALAVTDAQALLGEALRCQGKPEEAVVLLRNVLKMRKDLLGSEHTDYGITLYNLAFALVEAHKPDEAEPAIREALALSRRTVGDQHRRTGFCLMILGRILRETGRSAEAEPVFREALGIWKIREPHHVDRARTEVILVLREQGMLAEAEVVECEAVAEARAAVDTARREARSESGVRALLWLLEVLCRQGQVAEPEALLAEALEITKQLPPSAAMADAVSFQAMRIAALQVWLDRETEHTALCRQMLQWAADQPKFAPKARAAALANLRPVADPQLQASALSLAREAAELAPANSLLPWYQIVLGVAEYRNGHYPEAQRILAASELGGPKAWHSAARTGTAKYFRAIVLFRQGQQAAARQLFTETEATMQPLPAAVRWSLAQPADYNDLMLWLAYKEAQAVLNPP